MNRLSRTQFICAAAVLALGLLMGSRSFLRAQQPDPLAQQPEPQAQQPDPQERQADPNARAARLSFVEGDVQISLGSQILADPALVNTPLFEGTQIATREDGRAEVQFDDGTIARLTPNSSLKIAVLRQDAGVNRSQLLLESGLGYFELPGNSSAGQTTARFGDSSVIANGFTVLRISLDSLPGELAVFAGNVHLDRGNSLSLDLRGGDSISLNASDPSVYNLAETIEPDSWDAWNSDRDQDLTTQQAARTAASGSEPNSNNPAWGDLDANGNWYNVPGQGYVWSPNEAASGDWEPYGCGNWVWTPRFGYIWVSCEQWGYLPYTSGYWNYYDDFGWGWTPGFCYPWWTTGGWVANVGNHPMRYQPPHRPRGGPVHPPREPMRHNSFYQPNPVIPVKRPPSSPANPVHVVGRPVTIAGTPVEPLRPLTPRPIYSPGAATGFNRSGSGFGRSPYSVPANGGQGYTVHGYGYSGAAGGTSPYIPRTNPAPSAGRPGGWTTPAAPGAGYRTPVPSRGYSGASAPSRPSGGAAPHPGGGGGGGGRVSGGGGGSPHVSSGGGGGGASHPSGGAHH
jgi:hypothetical protein